VDASGSENSKRDIAEHCEMNWLNECGEDYVGAATGPICFFRFVLL